MISEGWAAFFPVYPAIGKRIDFNLALVGAESAWDGKLGAWAQEGESLLLGYEFRLSVRFGKALNANDGSDAFRTFGLRARGGIQPGPVDIREQADFNRFVMT